MLGGVALAGAVSKSSKGTAATQQRTRAPRVLQNTRGLVRLRNLVDEPMGYPLVSLFIATLGILEASRSLRFQESARPRRSRILARRRPMPHGSRSDRSVTTFPQQPPFPAMPVMCTPRHARRRPARRPCARCLGRVGQALPRNGGQTWRGGSGASGCINHSMVGRFTLGGYDGAVTGCGLFAGIEPLLHPTEGPLRERLADTCVSLRT